MLVLKASDDKRARVMMVGLPPSAHAPGWARVAADCSLAQSPLENGVHYAQANPGKAALSRPAH